MTYLSKADFDARFERRPALAVFDRVYPSDLHVDRDAIVSGVVESGATLFVHGDSHVLITGRIDGGIHVDGGAVAWVDGLVEGRIFVEGAAAVNGPWGVRGSRSAVVFDACEPADSETGA